MAGEKKKDVTSSAWQNFVDTSLSKAGYGYLLGDAALFVSAITSPKRNWGKAFSGLLWGVGGLGAARYGNPKAEQQLALFNQKLNDYCKKQEIKIPDSPDTAALIKPAGLIDQVQSFLYTYPAELLSAVYAIGGTTLMRGGFTPKPNDKGELKRNIAQGITGALITAGGLAGLLIKEKKPDPDHPAQSVVGKTLEWTQANPLSVSSTCYWLGNISLVGEAFKARKEQPQHKICYMSLFLTATSYIFANLMLSMSSKSHGDKGENKESLKALQEVTRESAAIIAAQPKEVQEELVQNIAGYLSAQNGIQKTASEIADLLHAKLAETKKSFPIIRKWEKQVNKAIEIPAFALR